VEVWNGKQDILWKVVDRQYMTSRRLCY